MLGSAGILPVNYNPLTIIELVGLSVPWFDFYNGHHVIKKVNAKIINKKIIKQ